MEAIKYSAGFVGALFFLYVFLLLLVPFTSPGFQKFIDWLASKWASIGMFD